MDYEDHANGLGHLVVNLQALETAIRSYLYGRADSPHIAFAAGQRLDLLKAGDVVSVDAMTDYRNLGQLIDRFNSLVGKSHPELRLDSSVVSLRDALAHGRVLTSDPSADFLLLKFAKPSAGSARVEYAQTISADWLSAQVHRVYEELQKVVKAMQ
ncbi:MAG: hypothetical protein NTV05_10455 [Acidobacteria bacterium]|nr:hypothetical protein [Acidobacteriota bacterium]